MFTQRRVNCKQKVLEWKILDLSRNVGTVYHQKFVEPYVSDHANILVLRRDAICAKQTQSQRSYLVKVRCFSFGFQSFSAVANILVVRATSNILLRQSDYTRLSNYFPPVHSENLQVSLPQPPKDLTCFPRGNSDIAYVLVAGLALPILRSSEGAPKRGGELRGLPNFRGKLRRRL